MAVTQIDVDDEALDEAMRIAGTRTKKETVNLALREFVASHHRVDALERYATLGKAWDHEGWRRLRAAEKEPGV
jgi:Arc/MetJ family transcription regulator